MEAKSNDKLKIYLRGMNSNKLQIGSRTTKNNSKTASELELLGNSKKSINSFTQILKSYEKNIKSSNFKLLSVNDTASQQFGVVTANSLSKSKDFNYNLSKINNKQNSILEIIGNEKYEFSDRPDFEKFIENFSSDNKNSVYLYQLYFSLSNCSFYEKRLNKIKKGSELITEENDQDKIINLKPQEIILEKNDSFNNISIKKIRKESANIKINDQSSIMCESLDISKTCFSSEIKDSSSKKYFQELHNEKLLFDEIERKVFKKENILSRNLEDNVNREYSILRMIEHKAKVIQNYYRRSKFKEKVSINAPKEIIFKGWDQTQKNLIQILTDLSYNEDIDSIFVKIYSLEKFNNYYENFLISDFFTDKSIIHKKELKSSKILNMIINKILEILYLKINLTSKLN